MAEARAQADFEIPSFPSVLAKHNLALRRARTKILQINVGKLCNLTCVHCHVNAGPRRKEIISRETLDRILEWIGPTDIPVVDITGGAPELIPDFRYFVERLRAQTTRRHIIDRCNLTILNEPGFEDMAEFLAENEVEVVASMPCYAPDNVNAQRGEGVFDSSVAALRKLNALGYGRNPALLLNLVYNPNGAFLPPEQGQLEADYKREMQAHFGIVFNNLYVITNMPISRYLSYLKRNAQLGEYMQLLLENFNPAAVEHLMCRDTLNVGWRGEVYDCDFNAMLDLPLGGRRKRLLWDIDPAELGGAPIATGKHCFGCTAGAGSSCQGEIA